MSQTKAAPLGRILVVDDEEMIVRFLQTWLVDDGYEVESAHSFDQVRAALARMPFDLMTLDIVMAEVDGLTVLRWVRAHYPDTGVVMATAVNDLDTVLEAIREGAISYLLKPFDVELASEEIARAMEYRRLVRENQAYQRQLERRVDEQTCALRQACARLGQKVRELEGRDRLVGLQMSPPEDVRNMYAEIVDIVAWTTGARQVTLIRPYAEQGRLVVTACSEAGGQGAEADGQGDNLVPEDALVAQVFREGKARMGDVGEVAAPIQYSREILGVLHATAVGEEDSESLLVRLAREVALVLHIARMTMLLDQEGAQLDELLSMGTGG